RAGGLACASLLKFIPEMFRSPPLRLRFGEKAIGIQRIIDGFALHQDVEGFLYQEQPSLAVWTRNRTSACPATAGASRGELSIQHQRGAKPMKERELRNLIADVRPVVAAGLCPAHDRRRPDGADGRHDAEPIRG